MDEFFDVAQECDLLAVAQRDRDTLCPRPRGATDAMHIGFRHVRYIVIHNMTDAVDIDAARGDIGRDERPDFALAKRCENAFALTLRFVAMNRVGGYAGVAEVTRDPIGAVLGSRED